MAAGSSLALELGAAADYANAPVGKLRIGVDTTGGLFTKDDAGAIQFYGVEGVEDIVGGMFVDTATIDFTYNDGLGQITADLNDGSVTTPKMGLTAGTLTFPDALNVALGTATGTQMGTGATQKLGFYGATPVAQIAGATDVLAGLVTQGLRAASSNPPLNLGTGALTAGATSVGALTVTSIGAHSLTGNETITDGVNFVLGTVTGTKIGTGSTQKLGFFNATPVVQESGSNDVLASLVTLGLRAASSNPPLDLGTGAITAGTTNVGALSTTSITATGTVALTDTLTVTDGKNIVVGSTSGTKIGTATTQKLGFFNATPVAQIAGSVDVLASLVTLGFRAASANPPLDLGTGSLGAASLTAPAALNLASTGANTVTLSPNGVTRVTVASTGVTTLACDLTFGEGRNMTTGTTTGTKIANATTQKLGFWNATPIVQPTRVGPIVNNVSGGGSTSPTIPDLAAASVDATAASLVSTRATCASLAAAIQSIETRLSAAGGGSGITA